MKERIDKAIEKAYAKQSKLSDQILNMEGYSGKLFRHFLNVLCDDESTRYFEVGSWLGSTVISASYNNPGRYTANDNFSQFGGTLSKLEENRNNLGGRFDIINKDNRLVTYDDLPTELNIYFYDGAHGYDDHKNAVTQYLHSLSDTFILLVDDWNGDNARNGTFDGIKEAGLTIVYERHQEAIEDKEGWWNGVGIFILE